MTGYTKLFNSIIGSTIWREDPATKVVWVTMLALADQDGIVEASVPGLADLARVTVEETRVALAKFMAPDEDSRTPDNEGRRIEPVDGGWRLLNHGKYRLKLSKEDMRERDRLRKQRYREQLRALCPVESGTKRDNSEISANSDNTHTEAIPNAKEHTHTTSTANAARRVCVQLSLSGTANRTAIQEVIDSEIARTSQSPGEIADRMISTRAEYLATPDKPFEYVSPIAFFRDGCWLRPESWKSAQPENPKAGGKWRSVTERMRELGQLPEVETGEPAKRKYVPKETDEECELRLRKEGRERRATAAAAKQQANSQTLA